VPQAAQRAQRDPETVRRWIRSGKLRSERVGTQHLIDEADLEALTRDASASALPEQWRVTWTGEPTPDWVAILWRSRKGH
jgi:excisionase family DNA binding protein